MPSKIQEIVRDSTALPTPGHYLLDIGTAIWFFFRKEDFGCPQTMGDLRNIGYTHYCPGISLPAVAVGRTDEPVSKRNFDELNEAHKKALERLTNQERDHQAHVKKLRERIQESELELQSSMPQSTIAQLRSLVDAQSATVLAVMNERDAARKTLANVRDLLNGIKIHTP